MYIGSKHLPHNYDVDVDGGDDCSRQLDATRKQLPLSVRTPVGQCSVSVTSKPRFLLFPASTLIQVCNQQ